MRDVRAVTGQCHTERRTHARAAREQDDAVGQVHARTVTGVTDSECEGADEGRALVDLLPATAKGLAGEGLRPGQPDLGIGAP